MRATLTKAFVLILSAFLTLGLIPSEQARDRATGRLSEPVPPYSEDEYGFKSDAFGPQFSRRLPNPEEMLVKLGEPQQRKLIPGQTFRLLVWNIYKNNRSDLESDLRGLTDISDLAVLQETVTSDQMNEYFNSLPGYKWLTAISFFDRNDEGTGVQTGARYLTSSALPLRSPVVEPIVRTPKMILVTEHPIEGREETLLVANIHAINFVLNSTFQRHLDQLEGAIENHVGPMIVAGDFNTHNFGRARRLAEMAERLDLDWVDLEGDRRTLKLDHVLLRGFDVHEAILLNNINSSDHRPILVDVKLTL